MWNIFLAMLERDFIKKCIQNTLIGVSLLECKSFTLSNDDFEIVFQK